jgi:dienelactone hydrolase
MKAKRILFCVLLAALAGCSSPIETPTSIPLPTETAIPTETEIPVPSFEELAQFFDYDTNADLEFRWGLAVEDLSAEVNRVSYVGAPGCSILGYLVQPEGEGPFPAVIYMHMGQANKDQYLDEAVLLAGDGVVSLLFDSPFLRGCAPDNRSGYINTVIDICRSIDMLETLDFVDAERIGYVGHSFGATWGGVLAGVEPRIKAVVLIAGTSKISQLDSPEVPELDAVHYIGNAQAAVLFQFSTNDPYISEEDATLYFETAPEPKTIMWYDTTHRGLQEDGQADRLTWLAEQLDFVYP